jgi:hypothetical protein
LEGKNVKFNTQRIMLSTWLIELYLDKINIAKSSPDGDLPSILNEFHFFLKTFKDHIHQETAFLLISSHGLEEELMHFAELIGDYDRMISYHIASCEYSRAVSVLDSLFDNINAKNAEEMYYKYVPLLLHYEPKAIVDCLMTIRSLDPTKFLPAMMRYDVSRNHPGDSQNHVVRYLEYCLHKKINKDPALYNYLISLYVKEESEDKILKFVTSQDSVNPCYDLKYALRLCHQEGKKKTCVHLYNLIGLHSDAVKLALSMEDLELAKSMVNACPPSYPDKRKLWLLIAEYVVQKEKSTEKAIGILHECQQLLHIEDILPMFPDDVRIGDFKDEISKALNEYTNRITELKEEMTRYTKTADTIRREIQKLKSRHAELPASRLCDVCMSPVLLRQFLLFPCGHAMHSDCAESRVRSHCARVPHRVSYFDREDFDLSEVLGGVHVSLKVSDSLPESAVMRDRLNPRELSRAECLYCGDLMIEEACSAYEFDEDGAGGEGGWMVHHIL